MTRSAQSRRLAPRRLRAPDIWREHPGPEAKRAGRSAPLHSVREDSSLPLSGEGARSQREQSRWSNAAHTCTRSVVAAGRRKAETPGTPIARKNMRSLHVLEERLVHLEHGRLAANHLAQRSVRGDHALVVQLLGLDVRPHRLHHRRAVHLRLARDGGQGGAERADLEEALARSLLLRRGLLALGLHGLALVLALLALAVRPEASLLLLRLLALLLLLFLLGLLLLGLLLPRRLLRLLRLLGRLLLRRLLLLRSGLLRAGDGRLLDLLRHLGNDDRKLRLHVCGENQARLPM